MDVCMHVHVCVCTCASEKRPVRGSYTSFDSPTRSLPCAFHVVDREGGGVLGVVDVHTNAYTPVSQFPYPNTSLPSLKEYHTSCSSMSGLVVCSASRSWSETSFASITTTGCVIWSERVCMNVVS